MFAIKTTHQADPTACTRRRLLAHYRTYPNLQIEDVFKFLYQSVFGCEHLISSPETVVGGIREEYRRIPTESPADIQPLDGDYCRVPLSYLRGGMTAETLGKLFVASAKTTENGRSLLLEKLDVAMDLVREGALPFAETDFRTAAQKWADSGYPPLHHSERFRAEYHPSYRVISARFVPFLPLFTALQNRSGIVAIEGGSASGKTTLSALLEQVFPCTVFHMDDFFLRPEQRTAQRLSQVGGNVDHERFLEEVLLPLRRGEEVRYRRFDCATMTLTEEERIQPHPLVIVEGAYSMHPQLASHYDFSVFLDIDPQQQRERILHRNSPTMAQRFFEEWIPLETAYFTATNVKERCRMILPVGDLSSL